MAPEQFAGRAKDERSNIFAFGAVLFEMLTGRKAFEGTNQVQMLAAICDEHRPRVSEHRQDIPSALDRPRFQVPGQESRRTLHVGSGSRHGFAIGPTWT